LKVDRKLFLLAAGGSVLVLLQVPCFGKWLNV
jgi:hypothetical protein